MVKMYNDTKNEVSMSRNSQVIACTDRHRQTDTQTDRQYENITSRYIMRILGQADGGLLEPLSNLSRTLLNISRTFSNMFNRTLSNMFDNIQCNVLCIYDDKYEYEYDNKYQSKHKYQCQ